MPALKDRAARFAFKALDLPPRAQWAWALPGVPPMLEKRWQERIDHAPLLTPEQHAAIVGLKEIEEPIGCDLCGERLMKPLFVHTHHKYEGYHVVLCPSCGFMYRHPGIKPERLGDLYAKSYSRFLKGKYEDKRLRKYRLFMDAFSPVFDKGQGRRVLDFGCGLGLFLDLADQRGFEPYGVDLSADSIAEARKRPSGRNAYFGSPLEIPEIAAGGFDVITLWSVLAHLATPVEDFRMLRSLLKPDGMLVILTVNANSLDLKARGPRWNGFTKNHLKFFSPTTLPLLLGQTGFEAMATKYSYGDRLQAGRSTMSARNQARVRRAVEQGNRGNMLRAVAFADARTPLRWGLDFQRVGGAGRPEPALAQA